MNFRSTGVHRTSEDVIGHWDCIFLGINNFMSHNVLGQSLSIVEVNNDINKSTEM